MHLKSIYALSIYAVNFLSIDTYAFKIHLCFKHLCLNLSSFISSFISFILSDGTQGNKHTEQFPGTDGEGQSHSSHNHYAAEKLTLCIGFQS